MKLATLRTDGATAAARLAGAEWELLDVPDVGAHLRATAGGRTVNATGRRISVQMQRFAPVIVAPGKMICVGHNFYAHIHEMGRAVPAFPTLFAKYSSALIGAHDDIELPAVSTSMDWEAELAVVVGRRVRGVDDAAARAAIAGYTVVNDVSARDWQGRTTQWLQGKNFDTTTPIGPVIVTGDDIDDASDLKVTCTVNGRVRQSARTSDLIFSAPAVVAYVSQIMTLDPGDVIALGTPGGVGASNHPPEFLAPGDVVETEIEGIGTLVNHCRAGLA
jgi:acylpyruvate hydrolase